MSVGLTESLASATLYVAAHAGPATPTTATVATLSSTLNRVEALYSILRLYMVDANSYLCSI
jgi:hypothetical protein